MIYEEFLKSKSHYSEYSGFDPIWLPDFLFDFQINLVSWAIKKGRCAIFADCGLGKTPMQLVWAENVSRKTNGNILIITPLAVSHQTIKEGEKFGIECKRSEDGQVKNKITITNYERLHHFNKSDFVGIICDESSILKNYDGSYRNLITEFMREKKYRLLCTATAAPNDYIELGTSSECLGELGYVDMLTRFFKNEQGTISPKRQYAITAGMPIKWRFKKHAEIPFWKWVSSWARALRKPSDLGFDDGSFILPPLKEVQTEIDNTSPLPGYLFVQEAQGLFEQRQELKVTLEQRCEKAAELVKNNGISLMWCNLNSEGDLLEKLIPDSVQVSGSDSDEKKEESLIGFSNGSIKTLITKPKIAGFGLNWQHCSHMTYFPSHSYEQYYQSVRRCWRFGQKRPVIVDIVTTQGGRNVLKNLQKKTYAADKMFTELVKYMNDSIKINKNDEYSKKVMVPEWL